uniref:Uncharacterized protein n=1 Tax=Arundo donax TaxID=35708 RepID=A0A0A9TXC0_ARUDO
MVSVGLMLTASFFMYVGYSAPLLLRFMRIGGLRSDLCGCVLACGIDPSLRSDRRSHVLLRCVHCLDPHLVVES